jgi:hypothetical protein
MTVQCLNFTGTSRTCSYPRVKDHFYLSHFKHKHAEFGMKNLQDIKLDFYNINTGSKSIHVSRIRTDGVQCSVVLSQKLEGVYERNKAEKEVKKKFKTKKQKDKEKRESKQRRIKFNKDYIVSVHPWYFEYNNLF